MFYIYKITNTINGKMYIGAHATDNIDDGYMGSGVLIKKAVAKYGKDNFTKEILSIHASLEEMYAEERRLVNSQIIESSEYYNLKEGGLGGGNLTEERKQKRNKKASTTIKEQYKNGRSPTRYFPNEDEKKSKAEKLKGRFVGEKNPMFGKSVVDYMTPEAFKDRCDKISKANTGKVRTEEHKKNYSSYASSRFWIVNKDGKLAHATDINDPRLISGEYQKGRKWNSD